MPALSTAEKLRLIVQLCRFIPQTELQERFLIPEPVTEEDAYNPHNMGVMISAWYKSGKVLEAGQSPTTGA